MDDFVIANLYESRNEWCSRLVSIFTPLVIEGIRSIFQEAWKMCVDTDEAAKYLMTFQNLLSRVPQWNSVIVETERQRIIERSGCHYLEDLITCVHIIQLKVLTCIRVGNKQKKIDISIPKLDHFIHKVYIHVARKVYMNVYLFEKNVSPLQAQKNGRELEMMIQECILTTIRESVPTEEIIRAYMEESVEHEEVITIEPYMDPSANAVLDNELANVSSTMTSDEDPITVPAIANLKSNDEPVTTTTHLEETTSLVLPPPRLTFNDVDSVMDDMNRISTQDAPKTLERLEEISAANALQRRLEKEQEDAEDENDRLKIGEEVDLGQLDILDMPSSDNVLLLDVEVL